MEKITKIEVNNQTKEPIETEGISLLGRIITEGYDDFQRIRIASANRIRDIIRKRSEGIGFSTVEIKKETKEYKKKYSDKILFERLELAYAQKKISKAEYKYLMRCKDIMEESMDLENKYKRAMLDFVSQEDIYQDFLKKVRGIGPVLSAKIIKTLGDCSNFETVSKLWAYCGLHVVDGKAPKRKKGERISFNPKLRSLIWNISMSLLKQNKAFYRKTYDCEKEKQYNKQYPNGILFKNYGKPYKETDVKLSKGHIHNRALRKMGKIFLDHYWHCTRELAGLSAHKNYVAGVLHHTHIITWREALRQEMEPTDHD